MKFFIMYVFIPLMFIESKVVSADMSEDKDATNSTDWYQDSR